MDVHKKEIFLYEISHGKVPFEDWLEDLKDKKARAIIRARLDRLEEGNPGEHEAVGNGVYELKIRFGPGYRVYFGVESKVIVILLLGGDKGTQRKDIEKACEYWHSYKESKK